MEGLKITLTRSQIHEIADTIWEGYVRLQKENEQLRQRIAMLEAANQARMSEAECDVYNL